jgi:ribosomal-protein-alanine N-acetyltransferase
VSAGLWIERASPDDAPGLAALEAECFSHPWTEVQFQDEVSYGPPGAVLLLRGAASAAEPGRGIRAYCVYRLTVEEMEILNVAVRPGWRRRGLGRWLVRFAMAKAARAGARRAFLEVRQSNTGALALYDALGFTRLSVRRRYYREPCEDALVLGHDLLF